MSDCLGIKFLSDDMMAFISSQKKGGTNGKLHCVTVSFNFFFRIINHYTLAPALFSQKMIFANNLQCYLRNDCLVPANYKGTTSSCQLRGFAWMIITSEDFFNKPFLKSMFEKWKKREILQYSTFFWKSKAMNSWTWMLFSPFLRNASRQTSNSTMRQKQTSRVLRAPFFFRSEKVQQLATIGLPSNYN